MAKDSRALTSDKDKWQWWAGCFTGVVNHDYVIREIVFESLPKVEALSTNNDEYFNKDILS